MKKKERDKERTLELNTDKISKVINNSRLREYYGEV